MAKAGRPTIYSEKMMDEIFERMIEGESLRQICRDEKMPAISVVLRWVANDPLLKEQYARAKLEQAQGFSDEIVALADEPPRMVLNKFGQEVVDNGWVTWQNNRVQKRQWIASKILPKIYGDKTIHSNDPDNPMPAMQIYCPKEENDKS